MKRARLVASGVVLLAAAAGVAYARCGAAAPPTLTRPQAPSAPLASSSAPPPAPSAIEPEVERQQARRELYERVDGLVHARQYERARQLLDDDQARYGDELAPPWPDLQQGYRLIADCLERPRDAKPRVRARGFISVTEAPALVPKVRAACGQ